MGITQDIGNKGEDLAAEYIKSRGFIISARNYRSRFGEIDIIAENEETITFIEVKTRSYRSKVSPREYVNIAKQRRIILTARIYIMKNYVDLQPRFDVAEIINGKDGQMSLNYIENAFGVDDINGLF